jgi:hypothetical protein
MTENTASDYSLGWIPSSEGLSIDIDDGLLPQIDPEDVLLLAVLLEDGVQHAVKAVKGGLGRNFMKLFSSSLMLWQNKPEHLSQESILSFVVLLVQGTLTKVEGSVQLTSSLG